MVFSGTRWSLLQKTVILSRSEFGFLGVRVITCTHTPRRNGFDFNAGALVFDTTNVRGLRTNWLIVGIFCVFYKEKDE